MGTGMEAVAAKGAATGSGAPAGAAAATMSPPITGSLAAPGISSFIADAPDAEGLPGPDILQALLGQISSPVARSLLSGATGIAPAPGGLMSLLPGAAEPQAGNDELIRELLTILQQQQRPQFQSLLR